MPVKKIGQRDSNPSIWYSELVSFYTFYPFRTQLKRGINCPNIVLIIDMKLEKFRVNLHFF